MRCSKSSKDIVAILPRLVMPRTTTLSVVRRPSAVGASKVYGQLDAGDVAGFVGRDPGDGCCDVFGLADLVGKASHEKQLRSGRVSIF